MKINVKELGFLGLLSIMMLLGFLYFIGAFQMIRQNEQSEEISLKQSENETSENRTFPDSQKDPPAIVTNSSNEGFQKGICVLLYRSDYNNLEELRIKTNIFLNRIVENNVNSLCIVVPLLQNNWSGTLLTKDPAITPSDDELSFFINEAHSRGLSLMLRPTIDERNFHADEGQWRGNIQPSDVNAWFENYQIQILDYAVLAEKEKVEWLSIGVELTTMEPYLSHWQTLIGYVRHFYHGRLIYSTNWDSPDLNIQFWDQLDAVGIDAFFRLDVASDASVEQLLQAWVEHSIKIKAAKERIGKPVILTELGTSSQERSFQAPWIWDHGTPADQETQRRFYEASCLALMSQVEGIYWWVTNINSPNPYDSSYNPLGKSAEKEIKKCYED